MAFGVLFGTRPLTNLVLVVYITFERKNNHFEKKRHTTHP